MLYFTNFISEQIKSKKVILFKRRFYREDKALAECGSVSNGKLKISVQAVKWLLSHLCK